MEDPHSKNIGDTSSGRCKRSYKGLILTLKNNADILRIYELFWKCKDDLGQPMGTFDQFRVRIGQYARFAVSIRPCHKEIYANLECCAEYFVVLRWWNRSYEFFNFAVPLVLL